MLCTLGNGHFATRGAAPESSADEIHYPGTYVTGCYNRLQNEIAGEIIENESLVNIPNWLPVTFRFEGGDWFDVEDVNLLEYRQELNIRQGVLSRLVRFTDDKGRLTRVTQRRFVSMANSHLAGLSTTIVAENWSGNLILRSALDGRVTNSGVERYRQLDKQHLEIIEARAIDNEIICLQAETNQSHIRIAETARTRLICYGECLPAESRVIEEPGYIAREFSLKLEEGKAVTIEKIVALYTSVDRAISESGLEAVKQVRRARDFDELLERHILSWDDIWKRCRITIANSERVALVLHLHIFHLLQTVSPHTIDRDAGVPPRGLHGEAYRGHILWDELFIFPFLNLRIPDITRGLLMYRYRRLGEARWAAKQAGYEGAMYPWQSGSDGREESQRLHLNPRSGRWIPDNSQLQRHINIAIAFNIWHYYEVTGDINFLSYYGAEMLIEIARFWASIARYDRSLDRYEIRKVMGPDEFHDAYPDADEPGIDNNAYTNIMVSWLMEHAFKLIGMAGRTYSENVLGKLSITDENLSEWERIKNGLALYISEEGIIEQFKGYFDLKELDWEDYRKRYDDIHRLDRILKAEGKSPDDYKLSKQADLLMAFFNLGEKEVTHIIGGLGYTVPEDYFKKNFHYYIARTSHGSTLSRLVHGRLAYRFGMHEEGWKLFMEALKSDLVDIQGGTTGEGIHCGVMAGTVWEVISTFAGVDLQGDQPALKPDLPEHWKALLYNFSFRNTDYHVSISEKEVKLSGIGHGGEKIKVNICGDDLELEPGQEKSIHMK